MSGYDSTKLLSLRHPGIPKKKCHIHREWSEISSRVTVGFFSLTSYCPCQPVGQFFQVHLQQPMLPRRPGNLLRSEFSRMRCKYTSVGARRYTCSSVRTTALQNPRRHTSAVDFDIPRISSTASKATPYVSMGNAAVTFRYEEMPSLPHASLFFMK